MISWFYVAFCYVFLSNFFVSYRLTLNRVGVKFLTSNQQRTKSKHACTMSLDGSPKAKIVYGKSSKILFKQKWAYANFTVLVHFWLRQIYPLKAQNIAKKLKFFKKLHPQEYQLKLTQS